MTTPPDEPGPEPATPLDVDAIAFKCRKLGHALVIDAVAQKNERSRAAGQVLAMMGMLLDGGRSFRRADASARDGLLDAFENARKALAAGFGLEAGRRRDQMAESYKASPHLNEYLGTLPPDALGSTGVPMTEVTAREPMSAIAARYTALLLEDPALLCSTEADWIADYLELCRDSMADSRLLGAVGTSDERRAAWTVLIARLLETEPTQQAGQRARLAERIIRACARDQGADPKNLFPAE